MYQVDPVFRAACEALARKAEGYAARGFRSYLGIFPDDFDRKAYDDESFQVVLRAELAEQERAYNNLTGYFPRLPDFVFASPKILGEYLTDYLLSNHDDLPEVQDPALLQNLPEGNAVLRALVKVYGLFKVRAYLKECFSKPYAEWKAAHDAELVYIGSKSRPRVRRVGQSKALAEAQALPVDEAPKKRLLTLKEAATYLGISDAALYQHTCKRRIKHSKPTGRRIYFMIENLDEWASQNKVRTVAEIQAEAKHQSPLRGKNR